MVRCYICHTTENEDNEMKHLPLYVYGSEGVVLCFSCRMALTGTIKHMGIAAAKSRKIAFKAAKALKEG